MSLSRLVITAVCVEKRSKSAVARDYGLSRRWVQKLCSRYATEGEAAFEPRSRAPKSRPNKTGADLEDEIVELRKSLLEEGLDAGAETIRYHLQKRHKRSPATSTIWRVLSRRGFVSPQPHKRPRSSYTRFVAEQPNELWQADITHVQVGRKSLEVLNMIDDHSRLLIGSYVRTTFKAADVVECFLAAFAHHGAPQRLLTDNAAVFTGSFRRGGFVALERTLKELGVAFSHPRPYHPQTCGKVERFHQTEKKYLSADKRCIRTEAQLEAAIAEFGVIYNTLRPHRGINRRIPAEVYAARPKAVPAPGQKMPVHCRLRHDVVDKQGRVTLRYNSELKHLGIGRAHKGKRVLVLSYERDARVLTDDGEVLAEFTIDPETDYQAKRR